MRALRTENIRTSKQTSNVTIRAFALSLAR